jgi:hypothetical protein
MDGMIRRLIGEDIQFETVVKRPLAKVMVDAGSMELGVSDAPVRRWMANGAAAVREFVLRERPRGAYMLAVPRRDVRT